MDVSIKNLDALNAVLTVKISNEDYLIKAKLKFKRCLVNIVPNNIIKNCNLKIKTKYLYVKYLNDGNNISLYKKVDDKNKKVKIAKFKNKLEKYQLKVYKELEKFLDIDDDTLYKLYTNKEFNIQYRESEILLLFTNVPFVEFKSVRNLLPSSSTKI